MIEHFLQKLSEKKIKVYDFKQIKLKKNLVKDQMDMYINQNIKIEI